MERLSKERVLTKVGTAEDEATGDAFEIFRFRKLWGRDGEVRVPRQKARDDAYVLDLVLQKNGDLPFPNAEAVPLVHEAIKQKPNNMFLYASQIGWRAGREAFVPPRGEPIGPDRRVKLLPPMWLNERQSVSLGKSGTVEGWIDRVAKPSARSRTATLTISAAFAAPLVEATGLQSFGINVYGRAKVGKTAALLAGASVAGIGRESQLPNWASTANATSELARLFSDTLLPANEVGLLAGKKKDAYGHIRELIYRLSEGRDKARHSSWHHAVGSASSQFRTIFVSTAEHSFDEYAAYAGEKRDEGEYARCIDVSAAGSGRSTVITSYPKNIPRGERRRWARKQVIALRQACEEHHGTVLRPYIEYLIARGEELSKAVATYQAEFMTQVEGKGVEGAIEHAARNMALVYAGGRLGIEAKLLPWNPERLLGALVACFKGSLGEIHYHQTAEARAIAALRKSLKKTRRDGRVVERSTLADPKRIDVEGYYEETIEGRIYTVHSKVFGSWFGDRRQLRLALDYLDRHGYLKPKVTEKTLDRSNLDWAEQTPKWHNGKSVRSIVFLEPAAKKKPIGDVASSKAGLATELSALQIRDRADLLR